MLRELISAPTSTCLMPIFSSGSKPANLLRYCCEKWAGGFGTVKRALDRVESFQTGVTILVTLFSGPCGGT